MHSTFKKQNLYQPQKAEREIKWVDFRNFKTWKEYLHEWHRKQKNKQGPITWREKKREKWKDETWGLFSTQKGEGK